MQPFDLLSSHVSGTVSSCQICTNEREFSLMTFFVCVLFIIMLHVGSGNWREKQLVDQLETMSTENLDLKAEIAQLKKQLNIRKHYRSLTEVNMSNNISKLSPMKSSTPKMDLLSSSVSHDRRDDQQAMESDSPITSSEQKGPDHVESSSGARHEESNTSNAKGSDFHESKVAHDQHTSRPPNGKTSGDCVAMSSFNDAADEVPHFFLCPITYQLMKHPVIAADGHTVRVFIKCDCTFTLCCLIVQHCEHRRTISL